MPGPQSVLVTTLPSGQRLTLNPISHIDPLGLIALSFLGIPVLQTVWHISDVLLPLIVFV